MGVKALHDLVKKNPKILPDLKIIVLGLVVPCSIHLTYDSFYYSRTLRSAFPQQSRFTPPPQVWTPVNAMMYNLKSSNLAQHGLHPRWLHIVVNFPLLFGLPLVGFLLYRMVDFLSSSRQNKETYKSIETTFEKVRVGYRIRKVSTSDTRKYLDRTGEFD